MKFVVLIPAFNEAGSIGATLDALMKQTRPLHCDQVVVIPNGCSDDTADIARSYPVTVMELPRLPNKKSEALNMAWARYAIDADMVITMDADTILPDNAVSDWIAEFEASMAEHAMPRSAHKALYPKRRDRHLMQPLGGSSSKFTMRGDDILTMLQRFEFASWTDASLRRQRTSVLAGTACAISGEALRQVAELNRGGPWSYDSQVEDFILTYQIRSLGYRCQVSPTVRAYTDSMKSLKSLWNQRMKWQVGTVEDLLRLRVNRLTWHDWKQQLAGLNAAFFRFLWLVVLSGQVILDSFRIVPFWLLLPLVFIASDIKRSWVIPHRTWKDVALAALLLPQEFFAWMRAGWFVKAWWDVLLGRITGRRKDRWSMQYAAEGVI